MFVNRFVCSNEWRLKPEPFLSIDQTSGGSRLIDFLVDLDETLNGRLPPEDSSDFDDVWTELIVMT